MLRDQFKGGGRQVRGVIRECWGQLINDKRAVVRGQGDRILGRLQARHGISEREVRRLLQSSRARWRDGAGKAG